MTLKSDFPLIGAETITHKGSSFGKTSFIIMDCESTNDLRSIFVGHIHFKKLIKFQKFSEIFHCCITRLRNKK